MTSEPARMMTSSRFPCKKNVKRAKRSPEEAPFRLDPPGTCRADAKHRFLRSRFVGLASWLWGVSLHVDLSDALAHGVAIVPCLHPQQCIHADTKGLLDAEGHLR